MLVRKIFGAADQCDFRFDLFFSFSFVLVLVRFSVIYVFSLSSIPPWRFIADIRK